MKIRKLHKKPHLRKGGGPNFGNRCKVYCPGCIVCDSWLFKDQNGRFPRTFEEAALFSTEQQLLEAQGLGYCQESLGCFLREIDRLKAEVDVLAVATEQTFKPNQE